MKRLFGVIVTAGLVVGGGLVALPGPASAGPGPFGGLEQCEADPPPEAFGSVTAYCAQLDITKEVDGDDPGVAFPVEVECSDVTSTGSVSRSSLPEADVDPYPFDRIEVSLKDGETETVLVPVAFEYSTPPPTPPPGAQAIALDLRVVECDISEDVADADLPAGWVCDDPDIDPETVLLGSVALEPSLEPALQSAEVTVTNDCTEPAPTATTTPAAPAAVEVRPTFTG